MPFLTMLTARAWGYIAVGLIGLAMGAGLAVQAKSLRAARAEIVRLEGNLSAAHQRADAAEKMARAAEALGATQAQEAAIVCQGEGAELFNRGRQVGVAIGRSQCPAS